MGSVASWAGRATLMGVAFFTFAGRGEAQVPDTLRERLLLPLPPMEEPAPEPAPPPVTSYLIFPGSTLSTPSALGAEHGTVFAGAGFQETTRGHRHLPFEDRVDGAVLAGFGLGDARELVGAEVYVTSYSTFRSGFFERIGLSFKVHRQVGDNTAVAVGWENALRSGDDDGDPGTSLYGVATRVFPLRAAATDPFGLLTGSIGIGNGRFRSEDDVLDDRETVNVFGSLALQIVRPVAAVADWTGQDLVLGASVAPFAHWPVVVNAGFADVLGTAGDGARFIAGIGFGHRFVSGPIQF